MLQPVLPERDLSRRAFGRIIPAPVVMASIGVQKVFHPGGELATAKVFGEMGLPFTLSTASTTRMEDVADANGADNPRWFQLYRPTDDELTQWYVSRAKENGYEDLVVTVDTWELALRPRDVDIGFFLFVNGIGTQIGLEDKVAQAKPWFNALDPYSSTEQRQMANLYHLVTTSRGMSPT
jgi:lactate 2-monooxygenase